MKTLIKIGFSLLIFTTSLASAQESQPWDTQPDPGTGFVHLRGVAYQFHKGGKVRLEGATIKVVEYPDIKTTVGKNGYYDLVVPAYAQVSPYITMKGYHTLYLQTFTTYDQDIDNVHFEVPSNLQYDMFALLIKALTGKTLGSTGCAIVTTVSDKKFHNMNFEQMITHDTYGLPGVQVFAEPMPPNPPIYFNDKVLPDKSQHETSVDGGVIWPLESENVTYTFLGIKAGTLLAPFVARCTGGHLINASVPQGIYELP
ncbi:MAG: hypothetical protein ACRC5A_00460 [Enterobacteriaceae bacterium]